MTMRHDSGHKGGKPSEKVLASGLVVRGFRELLVKPLFPEPLVVDVKRAAVLTEPGERLHLHGRVLSPGVELACLDGAEQFEESWAGLAGRRWKSVMKPST
jgi:hypothetical protein